MKEGNHEACNSLHYSNRRKHYGNEMRYSNVAGLSTLAAVSYDTQAANGNPRVLPPNARYRGLTYGEWGARWWQAAFSVPVVGGDHPIISGGAFGGEDGVLFLAAVVGTPVTVEITISA